MAVVAIFLAILLPLIWLHWIWLVLAILCLVGGLANYIITQRNRPRRLEQRLDQQLMEQTRGDRNLVERLIAYEKQRNPTASNIQLLQDALSRWQRDRRN
jgi:hypothetical protein